jgi:nitrate/nitrite transporter NarK
MLEIIASIALHCAFAAACARVGLAYLRTIRWCMGFPLVQANRKCATALSTAGPMHTSVQRPLLGNFSDQFGRGRVETCFLLFFCQILLRVLTAAMRELLASLMPFLRQP